VPAAGKVQVACEEGERVAGRASLPECDAEDARKPRAGAVCPPTMMKLQYEAR